MKGQWRNQDCADGELSSDAVPAERIAKTVGSSEVEMTLHSYPKLG